ncbi:MAG: tRNA (guanine-N1)-methyltransferase [Sulfurovum sp. PC08-66]|nr:MAG: tRNA (guanine-N1)-methyltransferase [Sulfurovum sp. PC08-66]KIM12499.1 MAG: tRNA (guanine-N1)-methyltransferase [Sulfuricurvum sp. PC08-66]
MRFTFVTLFANLVTPYFEDSILKRAIASGYLKIDTLNPRDFTDNKHLKVDDTPASGGAGMVMMPQPLFATLGHIKAQSPKAHIIITTPVAKHFTQNDAKRLATKEHLVFVSGRYEGIDERVIEQFADEVFSIGSYILTGGELASLVMCDAISRNVAGVLGNDESLSVESYESALLEAPSFTKPTLYAQSAITSEYLKGNQSKIRALKSLLSESKTKYFRPVDFENYSLRKST